MTLEDFNKLDTDTAAKELFSCCGSEKWVGSLIKDFPFASEEALVMKATIVWYDECDKADWTESFTHHPRIGDKKSLEKKFAGKEQSTVATAPDAIIDALLTTNNEYEKKFGFIFIFVISGKQGVNDRIGCSCNSRLLLACKFFFQAFLISDPWVMGK